MKLDLYLELRGVPVLIAWARETNSGVYIGVRFSPEVENFSYFKDGQRQLLRFPMMANGKRRREEELLEDRIPILEIREAELILSRQVDLAGESESNSPAPKPSVGATALIISKADLKDYPFLCYAAYIVRNAYTEVFMADKRSSSDFKSKSENLSIRLFPLISFPAHSLALIIYGAPTALAFASGSGKHSDFQE